MKNSIEFWHDVCMEVVRRDFSKSPAGTPPKAEQDGPTRTSRALAMAHLAMHDAHFGTTVPADAYLTKVGIAVPPAATPFSGDSAIAAAAIACLLSTYPGQMDYINEMTIAFVDANPDPVAQANGSQFGAAVAAAIIALRSADGSQTPSAYARSDAYGHHRPDPFAPAQRVLDPHWGGVTHFCATAVVPLDPPPGPMFPDFLTDVDYRADFVEVKEKGELISNTRTPEEWVIGHYWGYDGANDIGVPPRLYNQIVRAWLGARHPGDKDKAVKLLAIANAGMADAAIDAWHHKYVYDLWRPVVGIREASHSTGPSAIGGPKSTETVGADIGDPAWAPLGLPKTNEPDKRAVSRTPGFPAYPSGHATFGAALFQIMQRFSGAAAMTLQNVLDARNGGPAIAGQTFEFVSDELNGRSVDADGSVRTNHKRAFANFARPVYENSLSRVYLGVHWRFDGMPRADVAGKRYGGVPLGLVIGNQTFDFF